MQESVADGSTVTVARVATDVIVVGGGYAGLQAALTLGRMRFEVVVVDEGAPSNAPAHAIGGLLGAVEVAPLDLLASGRAQLSDLPSVRLIDGTVARVQADRTVSLADGTLLAARAVILATGMHYVFPEIPGVAELWGASVFHCPFCHAWEARDARIGVLAASREHARRLVPLLRRLSTHVEVFDAIVALRTHDGALRAVVVPERREVPCDVLFVPAPPEPRDGPFAHLPLQRSESELLDIDSFGRTSVIGVYAAGDLVATAPSVAQALASGQCAAIGVTHDLSVP